MAYQNVGTPRFFIDNYMYLRALGLDPQTYIDQTSDVNNLDEETFKTPLDNENAFTLSPEISKEFTRDGSAIRFFIPCGEMLKDMDFSGNMKWYGAMLNHNLRDCNARIQNIMYMPQISSDNNQGGENPIFEILNRGTVEETSNGSSIWYTDNTPSDDHNYRFSGFRLQGDEANFNNFQVGAISMGVMYTMPVSPDLKLNMEIQFDGYDEVETIGGSTLTNIRQTGAPIWNNNGQYNSPFSVGEFSNDRILGGAKRNGRRTWNLKFSYISDSDLFASNYTNTMHMETTSDYDSSDKNATGDAFEYNMFTDDSFVAQVWNKTLGGALPFIFQPDSSNDNPDQFCIAKLDMNSLKVTQTAFKSYEIGLKIKESW